MKTSWIDKLTSPQVMGALRHFLSSLGGVLVAKGALDGAMLEAGVGAIMAGLAFVASWRAKEKRG